MLFNLNKYPIFTQKFKTIHSAFSYSKAMGVQSGQLCPRSPHGVSLSLSLSFLLLFNMRTKLWTAQKFQSHYCYMLCRELSVHYSVFAFLLPLRIERKMQHLSFCIFLHRNWVLWEPHKQSCVEFFIMENFFSGSFGVAVVEITVDLISRVCKIAWKKKKT